jgi:hypothetical protein
MKAGTCFIILVGTMATVLCAAQSPGSASSAPRAGSAPQPASGALQSSSAPLPQVLGKVGGYGGYTRIVNNGQELYCRNELVSGSHAERHTVCLTPAQVAARQVGARDFIDKVQRLGTGTGTPSNGTAPMPMTMH